MPAQAQTAPQAIGIAVGGDNQTQLLWKNPDTSAAYWKLNTDGSVATQSTFGPFATYTPYLIAAGPNSIPRILWNKSGSPAMVSLWYNVQNAPGYDHHEFTNPSGFLPLSLTVDNGNLVRLFWSNAAGAAQQWQIAADNTLPYNVVYGPFSTYAPVAFAFGGSANVPRALWNKTDGTASIWYDVPGMTDYATQNFGPFSPYQAKLLAVGPNGVPRILWNNGSGTVSLWYNVQGAMGYGHSEYPIPAGYAAVGMAVGTDNTVRLLWSGPSGLAQVWTIQPGGTYTVKTYAYNAGTPAQDIPAPGWAEEVTPTDDASDGEEDGPASAGSVNLASGVEENHPGPDLWAYNPLGPGATYARMYRSKRAQQGYGSPGLSAGWTDNFDLFVTPVMGGGYMLTYDNGGQESWTGSTGSLTTPVGAPYLVSVAADGSSLTMTFKDHSKYTFTRYATATPNYVANTYLLTRIANLVGHAITLNRDSPANGYRVMTVTNDATTPVALLTFGYDAGGKLSTLTDNNARKITYGFTSSRLASVSQIGTAATPGGTRWGYGYDVSTGAPLLSSVQAPDPSNPAGMATATTVYDGGGKVAQHQDAAGRTRTYAYSGTQTQVQVNNANGSLAEKWTQKILTGKNTDGGMIDAANKSSSVAYGSASGPYLPSAVTNPVNHVTQIRYDTSHPAYGNVTSVTDNRGTQINTTYDYSTFLLGQPVTIQRVHVPSPGGVPDPTATPDSTLTPTQLTYVTGATPFNGLVSQVMSALPDAAPGAAPTVPTSFTYDPTSVAGMPLGNVSSVMTVGPNSTVGTTTTYTTTSYSYTNGAVTTPALGEPVSVTVTGQAPSSGPTTLNTQTTTFTYDSRGNQTSMTDASTYETDSYYTLADQLQAVVSPSTVGNASMRAVTYNTYQYPGGPLTRTDVYPEGAITSFPALGSLFPAPAPSAAVREVNYTYTAEGEVATVTGSTQPAAYVYDGRGRVVQSTDGNNHSTLYSYDAVGNLAQERFPLAGSVFDTLTYTYYDDYTLKTKTDGRGLVTTYARVDPDSLVTGVSYSAVSGVTAINPVGFTYDNYGRRATMTDGTGTTSYPSYDDLDNLLSVTKSFTGGPQNQTLSYAHNPDGSRLSLTWPTNVTNGVGGVNLGKTNYAYDGVGRQVQTKFPWLYGQWRHLYQANGWMTRSDGPLSPGAVNPLVRAQYSYNARGFLSQLSNYTDYSSGGSDLIQGASSFALTYDALGNKLTEAATIPAQGGTPLGDASHAITYDYDDANASAGQNRDVMLGETSTGAGSYNTAYDHSGANGYGYDAAYNPTVFSYWNGGADTTLSLPPNADNQINVGGFAYEGDGNPSTYKSSAFSYDGEDRLTNAPALNVGGTFTATYDGDGLRATKTVSTSSPATTYYLYDGGSPIIEETYSGTSASFSALNGWTADGWRARKQGNLIYQFVYDPQGSVQQRQTDTAYSTGQAAYDRSTFEGYGALRGAYKGSTGGAWASTTRRASGVNGATTRTRRRVCCA